jgi:hypothetical protein
MTNACPTSGHVRTTKPKLTPAERAERKAESALHIKEGVEDIMRQMIALGMLTADGKPPGRPNEHRKWWFLSRRSALLTAAWP